MYMYNKILYMIVVLYVYEEMIYIMVIIKKVNCVLIQDNMFPLYLRCWYNYASVIICFHSRTRSVLLKRRSNYNQVYNCAI